MKNYILLLLIASTAISYAKECDLKWSGLPFDQSGNFHSECRPRVLYSWIDSIDTINKKDYKWPFRRKRAIFFHRTPLATSIYGDFSYRVKLKENVRFKLVPWNEAHYKCLYPEEEKKYTVYVNQDKNGFSEYVLCSSGPVESWSFGLKAHLEEMKNEFNSIKKYGAKNVDGFVNPNKRKDACDSCFQGYSIHDARNDGSEDTILKSIERMQRVVGQELGGVYNLSDRRFYTYGVELDEHFSRFR